MTKLDPGSVTFSAQLTQCDVQPTVVRPPLNLVDSSDFLPLIFMGWDIPGEHPEPLKNNIEFLVFSHFSFIFWCWLLYLGHWAENQ